MDIKEIWEKISALFNNETDSDYELKFIAKEEYSKAKLLPINIQGEACKKGNRLFNFDSWRL